MAQFTPAPVISYLVDPAALICLSRGMDVLLTRTSDGTECFPTVAEVVEFLPVLSTSQLFVGTLDGKNCVGAQVSEWPEESFSEGFFTVPARHVLATFSPGECAALCRARILLGWRKAHRLCGACGQPLSESPTDMGLICEACGTRYYPQIAPAVIVLVTRNAGKEILLAHNRKFAEGLYGLLAGFVEAGESAENAVRREIREEVGIEVKNIEYRLSQSWPFPNSLMLGYRAEYAGGEPKPDGEELDAAQWFTRETLPQIPRPGSIARRLLDEWLPEGKKF